VEIGGASFRLLEILKHDSWAATAIYASATGKALCKFNRRQPILRIPMACDRLGFLVPGDMRVQGWV
jgi:hypothetical protein